jgi:hypothetical protein
VAQTSVCGVTFENYIGGSFAKIKWNAAG